MTSVRLRALTFAALLLLLALLFLQSSRSPVSSPGPHLSPQVEVRFTRPTVLGPQILSGGPEAALIDALDAARRSIDMAIYDLDLESIKEALLRAEARRVEVRLVVESDNLETTAIYDLIAAGIPLAADGRPPLMHDKFTVIDGQEVWTGSMNYTVNDAYFNDNNLVRLRDPAAARAFTAEFNEMFDESRFGALSPPASEIERSTRADGTLEVVFAPEDGVAARVIEWIEGARSDIAFLAFALTSDDITRALAERAGAGVAVRGVLDAGQAANLGSRYPDLLRAGIEVRLDGNRDRMHHKVIIIDGRVVLTGSYNFSRSAELENDENLIVLADPAVAGAYLEEFERIFALATP